MACALLPKTGMKKSGLKAGSTPYWLENGQVGFQPPEAVLSSEVEYDAVVIGAGITGLSTGLSLVEAGHVVALVDSAGIGAGETRRTTGHLTEAIDARYQKIESRLGAEAAGLVAQASRTAIEQIATWVQRYEIDCRFFRLPGYFFCESGAHAYILAREMKAARRAGLATRWSRRAPLPFPLAGAVEFPDQATLQPVSYINGLAQAFVHRGGRIFLGAHVQDIRDSAPCEIKTTRGTIRAREVVVATHTPISDRWRLHIKNAAYRTYSIAVKIQNDKRLPGLGLFWDTAEPYHYLRPVSAEAPGLWIIGGEDHKTGHSAKPKEAFDRLRTYARDHLGPIEVLSEWSGQIYEPVDSLPYIGRSPGYEHVWMATGFSGNGLTFGTLAGRMIADEVEGRVSTWSHLFRPGRIKFLSVLKNFPKCMVTDRLRAADVQTPEDIAPGEGKLLKLEGSDRKIACYREENGALHSVSSTCPHMGCLVRFNSAEKSWDCPCHGSRFSADGDILSGPALSPLEKVEVAEPRKKRRAA